ncbi:uncharacterized protein Dh44 [Drosophila virilis]|uniref:Corticotropin-releasing factor domain-containing protein n=1 Tax=Drosophila virilis TaxID=7244 RepID=B4M496_DROVI|nr:uncharacterized protein LOC6632837 [Drosophila virilis]EDW59457.1 uncharacterized protein Dvir_GJ10898 [Drosophila virilis]
MMKATAWFCPVLLTLLSATRFVCTAQRGAATTAAGGGDAGGADGAGGGSAPAAAAAGGAGYANGYPLDYLDAQAVQAEYSLVKRNKPSLSIVNPLDVLRQRLLLEIARRQMKENTRQVELNRAILKNVGKRVFLEPATWGNSRYQQQQQQQQLERQRELLRREQLQQQHFPSQLWSYGWPQSDSGSVAGSVAGNAATPPVSSSAMAASRFFDFLQPPAKQQQLLDDANKSLNAGALGQGMAKHQQPNGNEIANETNHLNGNRKSATSLLAGMEEDQEDNGEDQDEMLDELNLNWANEQPMDDMDRPLEAANANGRLPWRLIYRMHKNPHYAN